MPSPGNLGTPPHAEPLLELATILLGCYNTHLVQENGTWRVIPDGNWMKQMARNLTDPFAGFLRNKKYLIHDRDSLFTEVFAPMLKVADVKTVKLPPQSPNLNAIAERFVRSVKSECLERIIFFGETSLRRGVEQFMDHYHRERNHQCLANRLIQPKESVGQGDGTIQCRKRLGGLLRYYHRAA